MNLFNKQQARLSSNREVIASIGYSPCAVNATLHYEAKKETHSSRYCSYPGVPHVGIPLPSPRCGRTRANDYFLSAVVIGNPIAPNTACAAVIKVTDVNLGKLDNRVNYFQLYFNSLECSEYTLTLWIKN
jgi:hypothetical protein